MSLVEVRNLSFTYPDSDESVLHDLSFEIEANEWVAIIGHNGSGKSTLARLIDGLLSPDQGSIRIDQLPVDNDNLSLIHQKIGFVFQNPDNQFVGATVADDIAFGLENRQISRPVMQDKVQRVLKRVDMVDFANHQPEQLSGGQKQRVAIAGILALAPQLLILDEATSMLDPEGRAEILNLIVELRRESKLSVLSITHDLEEALLADRVILMDKGRIIKVGTPQETVMNQELMASHHLKPVFVRRLLDRLTAAGISASADVNTSEQLEMWLWKQLDSKI